MWNRNEKVTGKYQSQGNIWMIPVSDIRPNPHQPRKEFPQDKLMELAQSISENGLLQPITIRFEEGKPVLVAGERRLRAAKLAGMMEIPCIEVRADAAQTALLTLIENIQRQDMNCFEEAEGIERLIHLYGLTQEEAAFRLGYSQPTVANKLRLLRLSEEEQQAMTQADLTERHARALLRIPNEATRLKVMQKVIEYKMNVAQTEKLVEENLARKLPRHVYQPLVKDVRIFINTVNHAVETMKRCGIAATSDKVENDDYFEITVRIPKKAAIPEQKVVAISG